MSQNFFNMSLNHCTYFALSLSISWVDFYFILFFFNQYLTISFVMCLVLQMEILHKLEQGEGKIINLKKQMNKTTHANFSSPSSFKGKFLSITVLSW